MDGSWSGFADDLFIKDELPDHTAESAKDIIIEQRSVTGRNGGRGQVLKNLRKLETVPSIRQYGERRRLTSLVLF